MAQLNDAWQKASSYIYQTTDDQADTSDSTTYDESKASGDDNVTDVDYEEVD